MSRTPATPIQAAANRIRGWLVQTFRYTASTIELDEVLVREITRAVLEETKQVDFDTLAKVYHEWVNIDHAWQFERYIRGQIAEAARAEKKTADQVHVALRPARLGRSVRD